MSGTAFTSVDWSQLPPPEDDGGATHLPGARLPNIPLPAHDGGDVELATLSGRTIVFAYPMTGTPGVALPAGWDDIPGARGCTPQSCAFRDLDADLKRAGADAIFGVSTQTTAEQREAASRLHLPFRLLSDRDLRFAHALGLPTMEVDGRWMLKRLTMVLDDGVVTRVFYPVFPPDRNAADVLAWLAANPR